MVNKKYLHIIKQGASVWNKWRKKKNAVLIDLKYTDLEGIDLSEADLSSVNFKGAKLKKANFRLADFSNAYLETANLNMANLSEANLRMAYLRRANLSHADLNRADLTSSFLAEADLQGANFENANLSKAILMDANIRGANFQRANLVNSNLIWANLFNADLREANLQGASLGGANLGKANLSHASLKGAKLSAGTNLDGANIFEADFSDAEIGWLAFGDVDLSVAKGLNKAQHRGPSSIGIDTIYKSKGNIPVGFLREAGVPENFIAYISSLVERPIQFYSCFISYSTNDQLFAERLYADLKNKGVRCWFAPADMKIGHKIRHSIDQSIRLYDKLLLVLSKHSIDSEWVEKEVETAFEQERLRKTTVLFPIRLDSAVMDTNQAWAADIRRTRYIGDFTQCTDPDAYKISFTRLLRDLQSTD